jgi:ABC-2 type transport system permease protein
MDFSPLTYFARGVRAVTMGTGDPWTNLAVLAVLAAAFFAVGAASIPRTD